MIQYFLTYELNRYKIYIFNNDRKLVMKVAFWKKKNEEDKNIDIIKLKKSKTPILILDKNWHYMFPPGRKTQRMLDLEKELNKLLKEQGNLTNQQKDYKKLKKEYMNKIVTLMEEAYDNENDKAKEDMIKSQKSIEEINQKVEDMEQRLYDIPNQIKQVNNQLLSESVQMCYDELKSNRRRLNQLNLEISDLRQKLKDRIEEKTLKEEMVERTYTFLHNLVGADIVNKLDKNNLE